MPPKTMNPTKYAKRLKEIRKVKFAIKFRDNVRKERRERFRVLADAHNYAQLSASYNRHVTRTDLRAAQKAAREDWELGSLRPNRKYGANKDVFGALDRDHLAFQKLPEGWFGGEGKLKKIEKKGAPREVLLDRFPIVKEDRVVVVEGTQKGRIGTVRTVDKESYRITVGGVNQALLPSAYLDNSLPDPVIEWEIPLPYNHVRLLMPQDIYRKIGGRTVKSREDVIVESIDMEKHTRGIDPYTGRYAYSIPEAHQKDPKTGVPIYHRYVAGTRVAIPWPWEKDEVQATATTAEGAKEVSKKDNSIMQGVLQKLNPLSWLGSSDKEKKITTATTAGPALASSTPYDPEHRTTAEPSSDTPEEYPSDTPRNLVEADSLSSRAEFEVFIPTLVYPPMPEDVVKELSPARAKSEAIKAVQLRAAPMVEKKAAIEKPVFNMKTPMQLRWEMMQEKKREVEKEAPGDLLEKIGGYMAGRGLTVEKVERVVERERMHL